MFKKLPVLCIKDWKNIKFMYQNNANIVQNNIAIVWQTHGIIRDRTAVN